jgi:predicted unusual protein kinase regulating ubiquinone biosynthesis (AarF/ABC1/UbiB family)
MPSLIPFFYPGRVALIDFGLMAQMDRGHQEAMASGVLNIMAGNYEALVDIFKEMGVLDSSRADLRR